LGQVTAIVNPCRGGSGAVVSKFACPEYWVEAMTASPLPP
jgi:hypothetical protein